MGNYFNVTIIGTTCLSPSLGTTLLPNIMSLPQMTNIDIQAIILPSVGSMVYNLNNNCVSVFNGVSWNCMAQISSVTITTSGYILNAFNNYILYTGPTGTMNIPPASTCPNREYYIINQGTGIITLNLPYYSAGVNTIPTATTVHLVAIGSNWYKVN